MYEKLKRNFAISAFISLENFVTSGKIARGQQIVMKRGKVVVSKQNNSKDKKVSDHYSPIKSFQRLRETSVFQPCWLKDANKASFINKLQKSSSAQVLQLGDPCRHTAICYFPEVWTYFVRHLTGPY